MRKMEGDGGGRDRGGGRGGSFPPFLFSPPPPAERSRNTNSDAQMSLRCVQRAAGGKRLPRLMHSALMHELPLDPSRSMDYWFYVGKTSFHIFKFFFFSPPSRPKPSLESKQAATAAA